MNVGGFCMLTPPASKLRWLPETRTRARPLRETDWRKTISALHEHCRDAQNEHVAAGCIGSDDDQAGA